MNVGALVNGQPTSDSFDNTTDSLERVSNNIGQPQSRTNFQSLETMVGVPDAANSNVDDLLRTGFDSTGLTANEDGSIIERLEQIQEAVNRGTGTSLAANRSVADALGTDGVTVTDGAVSVLGAIGVDNANNAFASTSVVANRDGSVLERLEDLRGSASDPKVTDVIIYPVAEDLGTTEITTDGTSPAYMPAAAHSTAANAEGTPGVAWTEDINFEQEGTITLISIYAEFEWQTRFLIGAGGGTTSSSKIQISRDAGASWVDLTDNYDNTSATFTTRIRAGVGLWVTTIVAGVNQLGFRLVHWTNDGGGVATSEAQIRSNSYIRISYRKT